MQLPAEQLTKQFYDWEILGRGWILGKESIELEPPFTPFFGHYLPKQHGLVDDGLHHTLLSKAVSLFTKKPLPIVPQDTSISYQLFPFDDDSELTSYRITIPKNYRSDCVEIEQFLTMLSYGTSPMSFELIGTPEKISIHFNCRKPFAQYLKSQLNTYFPEICIIEREHDLNDLLLDDAAIAVVDFGLQEEFVRPLAQFKPSKLDPFTGLFSLLDHLTGSDRIVYQVVFNGVINPWESSILRSVSDGKNGNFFMDAPEMLPLAKEKVQCPLFAVTIRLLTQSDSLDKAFELLDQVAFAITNSSRSMGNSLIPLSDKEYTVEERITDILYCESHRLGMLLNVRELASFVHLPSIASKKLLGTERKTKAPMKNSGSFILGINEHNGISTPVTTTVEQRLKHTHIIGATGTGKSTLMLNLVSQDIRAGNGIAVLDPHGDLIEAVIQVIPEHRINDVLILDPSDSEFPFSFNILQAHSEIEKEILSGDLVATFKRLSTSWGDQMNSVLANAILAFLESSKGGTLIDLRRFLIEKDFRQAFLKTVQDRNILYYWQKEYQLLKTNSIGPILTRLDSFLRSRIIRNMVAQKKGLDFEDIINSKKILLVKLSQGLIGNENSYMLGTFIVSKIHQAAFARQAMEKRNDYFLYVDEFQHFITPSMSAILSGARKYHLGLVLAHQDMQQLQKYDTELSNSITSNASTRICFRLGDTDAKRLAEGVTFFESKDFQNLNIGEAIVRLEKPENDFSLSVSPENFSHNKDTIDRIILLSRNKYCTSKEIIESELFSDLDIPEEKIIDPPSVSIKSQEIILPINKIEPSESFETSQSVADDKTVERIIRKKEQTQHRYLQNLIKKMAEARGFKATIEAASPNGKGKVDVLLERESKTIACEVSVTTDSVWEIHNIQKCIEAGYDTVISCQSDAKALQSLHQKASDCFSNDQMAKIKFFSPESLFNHLDEITVAGMETESVMKGYRVKVSYDAVTPEEMSKKREAVAKVVAESMKKLEQK